MAKIKRSIWELRFRALAQQIELDHEHLKRICFAKVMDCDLDDLADEVMIDEMKKEDKILSRLKKRARQIETKTATQIWLQDLD